MSWGTRIKSLALIRPRSNNVLRGRNACLTQIVCRKDSPGCGATNINYQVIHTVPVVPPYITPYIVNKQTEYVNLICVARN